MAAAKTRTQLLAEIRELRKRLKALDEASRANYADMVRGSGELRAETFELQRVVNARTADAVEAHRAREIAEKEAIDARAERDRLAQELEAERRRKGRAAALLAHTIENGLN
jgi:hypothetical protein